MAWREQRGRGGIARDKIIFIFNWTPVFTCAIFGAVKLMLQGRELEWEDLHFIRQLIAAHPDWSRRRLSQTLCEQWNWRNGAGQLKDMASRSLLLKLEQRGHIELPARRQTPVNRMRQTRAVTFNGPSAPCEGSLKDWGPLQVSEVSRDPVQRAEVQAALAQFHYLGFGGTVGENLQYTVRSKQGQLLACLVFGSAAWKCAERDRFIGWNAGERHARLSLLTNNTRFLVLPWVQVRHLASWTLSAVLRRLSGDWQTKYGHPIYLVETFVERERFGGVAYRAGNWINVGHTTGRTRQDRFNSIKTPVKDIYLYPLARNFRSVLCP